MRFAQVSLIAAGAVGLALIACGSGPKTPTGDGGGPCQVATDCPILQCLCPLTYQSCMNGLCPTSCPAEGSFSGGEACQSDCECASTQCANDTGACCATAGMLASGSSCAKDCDCISGLCQGSCQ